MIKKWVYTWWRYFKGISNLLRKFLENYGTVKNYKGKNSTHTNNQTDVGNFIAKFEADYLIYLSGENTDVGIMDMYEYITKKMGKTLGLRWRFLEY